MVKTSAVVIGLVIWALGGFSQAMGQQKVFSQGEWSPPVFDSRGFALRGRLVLCEKPRGEGREVSVYIELQDARDSVGGSMRIFCEFAKTDFRPESKGGLRCQMLDKEGKEVPSTSYPFGGAIPESQWVTLPSEATIRLRVSPWSIYREKAIAISPLLGQLWVIGDDDPNEYSLTGVFTVDPEEGKMSVEDPHIWRGTIKLPAVRIVNAKR